MRVAKDDGRVTMAKRFTAVIYTTLLAILKQCGLTKQELIELIQK
jgi:hypothetical protein